MLLAEELLLMLVDDVTGRLKVDPSHLDLALAGALLAELAEVGRVAVSGPGEPVRTGRLVVRDGTPTGDPVLDGALRRIGDKNPRKPETVLGGLTKRLRSTLLTRLADRGILRKERHRTLGIFPTSRWPANDTVHEQSVRSALHDVLVVGRTPQPREIVSISLLAAVDRITAVLPDTGLSKRDLRRRAKELTGGEFAGEAVRKAIQAANASMAATSSGATTS
jgi:hypothetical protein